ncbi:unnamed protein product [Vicia faba]|uniref:Uncharacterized protein n=1 Tax=Vicia faba TaxID=3906 RepID=A0AAV1AYH6_VICFA|nr:unnamed protein product [Vicia faba]
MNEDDDARLKNCLQRIDLRESAKFEILLEIEESASMDQKLVTKDGRLRSIFTREFYPLVQILQSILLKQSMMSTSSDGEFWSKKFSIPSGMGEDGSNPEERAIVSTKHLPSRRDSMLQLQTKSTACSTIELSRRDKILDMNLSKLFKVEKSEECNVILATSGIPDKKNLPILKYRNNGKNDCIWLGMKIEEYMKMENFGMAWTWKFTHGILAPLGLRNFVQVHFVIVFSLWIIGAM